MINNIRYIEKTVSQNGGGSLKDLENTNYWELLKIYAAKGEDQSRSQSNNSSRMNAYDFLKNHAI